MGEGVVRDYKEAVTWFSKAAEQGVATAQYSLGKAYECGTGIRKNSRLALKWFRAAANQGNEMAAEKLKEIAG